MFKQLLTTKKTITRYLYWIPRQMNQRYTEVDKQDYRVIDIKEEEDENYEYIIYIKDDIQPQMIMEHNNNNK